jgi:hypothetical protein
MQFKDLAEQMSKESPVKLTGEVVERKGKKDRPIQTFMLVAQGNPRRAIYRKNLRVDGAAFLASEVPTGVMQTIKGEIVGLPGIHPKKS